MGVWANEIVPRLRVGKRNRGAEGGVRLGLHSYCHSRPRESSGREDISVRTSCECGAERVLKGGGKFGHCVLCVSAREGRGRRDL